MKSFFSKSYKELFVALTVFSLLFTLLEIIGFSYSDDSSIWVLQKSLCLNLCMIIISIYFLTVLIVNFIKLRKTDKKPVCDFIAFVLFIYLVLLAVNSTVFLVKILTGLT